jgi:hypothetical protein
MNNEEYYLKIPFETDLDDYKPIFHIDKIVFKLRYSENNATFFFNKKYERNSAPEYINIVGYIYLISEEGLTYGFNERQVMNIKEMHNKDFNIKMNELLDK